MKLAAFTTNVAVTAVTITLGGLSVLGERPLTFEVDATPEHFCTRGVCVGHKVPANSLVTGYFSVTNPHPNVRASVLIYEGGNQPFSQQELNGEARFSFRSRHEPAQYEACVRALPKNAAHIVPGTTIDVDLLFKPETDKFDEEVAKGLFGQVEGEFFALERQIRKLADELNTFVLNEEKLRDTNESTLDKLRVFALFTIMVLVGLGLYQIYYMKQFFKAKKVI